MSNTRKIKYSEVEKHTSSNDCWVVIDGGVYDLTAAMKIHPPGPFMIQQFAGKDASWMFNRVPLHSAKVLKNKEKYRVGTLINEPGVKIPNNSERFLAIGLSFLLVISYFIFF